MTAVGMEHPMIASNAVGTLTAFPPAGPRVSSVLRRILVATDGSPAADGALRLADQIARQDDVSVHVVSVLEPEPDPHAGLFPARLTERVERRFAHVREQVRGLAGMPGLHTVTSTGGP